MNSPKKFRIWDHITESFSYFDIRSTMGMIPSDIPDHQIQQSTGLFDMNGREVFVGDFVTLRTVTHTYHTQVIFCEGCFAFKILSGSTTLSLIFAHVVHSSYEIEVFGSLWEGDQEDIEVLGKYSPKPKKNWHCKRCGKDVVDIYERCDCITSPTPLEPI